MHKKKRNLAFSPLTIKKIYEGIEKRKKKRGVKVPFFHIKNICKYKNGNKTTM